MVKSITFSPDRQTLVSGNSDGTIKLWNLSTRKVIKILKEHSEEVTSVAISSDGTTLASGSADNSIKLWDITSGQHRRTLSEHSYLVNAVAFSPDGTMLASGSADKTIKLWNLSNGRLTRTIGGHFSTVGAIAYSPDGTMLASGSADRTIKLWNTASGQLIRTLQGHTQDVPSIVFSPDGQTLAIILPQAVAEIPWGHNILLLEKVKDLKARFWYVHKTLEHGWSRSVLWHHIDTKLYERQFEAEKTTNFNFTLPSPQSDLARELLKDPYNFDFLTLAKDAQERDLERGLLEHIREFLLELGVGFAFMGSQYHLKVGEEDFYIDLLFYHVKLRCYVVIDLKMKEFKPEFSGKMSFYVSAVDDILRHPDDQPTIGIILCKSKDKTVVEYSLQNMNRPIGVSTYKLRDVLPEKLQGSLPTIEQLEAELDAVPLEIEDEE
ncbi:DUF1016 family protein [Scytonema sp. UIC 10036]|uniref:PDDEXK nuclease domain-containing protein n=1 Tax=Scytonema sp. UIC 10036 TaxID=2304196 RepID=UPI00137E1AA8|nr:DUF1016 family protein [Scytonema sp. UIC 10036]